MAFTYKDVQEAYERIKPYIRRTPLEESYYLGGNIDGDVLFQLMEKYPS